MSCKAQTFESVFVSQISDQISVTLVVLFLNLSCGKAMYSIKYVYKHTLNETFLYSFRFLDIVVYFSILIALFALYDANFDLYILG